MATKALKELKKLSKTELENKVRETQAELFQAKMKSVTGQLENSSTLWVLRKRIARAKTLITQQGAK